jgi:hypothetical protein
MSASGLQTLMVTAVTDRELRNHLLDGDLTACAAFELSAEEIVGLQTITASTLEDFARQAHCLFYGEDPLADASSPSTPYLSRHLIGNMGR